MTPEIIQQLSIHACFFSVLAIAWRIRQVQQRTGFTGYLLMTALASLAMSYFQEGIIRIEGNNASPLDLWRELSLLLVMSLRISIAGKDGNL